MAKRLYATVLLQQLRCFKMEMPHNSLAIRRKKLPRAGYISQKKNAATFGLKDDKGGANNPETMNAMRATVVLVPAGFCVKNRRSTRFSQ